MGVGRARSANQQMPSSAISNPAICHGAIVGTAAVTVVVVDAVLLAGVASAGVDAPTAVAVMTVPFAVPAPTATTSVKTCEPPMPSAAAFDAITTSFTPTGGAV